jgi:hypothetical protein
VELDQRSALIQQGNLESVINKIRIIGFGGKNDIKIFIYMRKKSQ